MANPIGDTTVLTTIHFVLIAILIALTIAGIAWGMRLKRGRVVAEEAAEQRAEEGETPAREPVAVAPSSPLADASAITPPEPTRARGPLDDERITAAAPLDASPAAEAAPAPAPPPAALDPAAAQAPVTMLKGLGPKVAALLADHGITTVGQLAALDAGEAEAIDARLGPFTGRMARDRWIDQARFLAAGDQAGFEAVFGRL